MALQISELWHYPLKSAQGLSLPVATLDAHGLQHDRRWLLVDADGRMLTQRQQPRLGALQVQVSAASLILTWAGQSITAQPRLEMTEVVQVWDDHMPAHPVASVVNQQLSHWLGLAVRLVYCPDQAQRRVDPEYAAGHHTGFSDGFPMLLLSQASLDHLSVAWGATIDVRRFRPNLVVAGDCAAFAEDTWSSLKVGELVFDLVKPCSRCVIPTLNPEDQQSTQGFARFLASQRRHADRKIYLGQNLVLRQAQHLTDFSKKLGQLKVGDQVDLLH